MGSETPTSRTYRHTTCGELTQVTEHHFSALADPFAHPARTICASCSAAFELAEFVWDDTDESLSAYYARHTAGASGMDRMLGSRRGFGVFVGGGVLLGLVAGGGAAYLLGVGWGIGLGLLGVVVLGFAGLLVWDGPVKSGVLRRVCGVDDARDLD